MMRSVFRKSELICKMACAAAALPLLIVSSFAQAQSEDTSGTFMKDILGSIGIVNEDADAIDYRERAPLVLPPNINSLPEPRATGAGQPNWPKDHDLALKERAEKAANAPVPVNRGKEAARPLRPDELKTGPRIGSGIAVAPPSDGCHGDACSGRPLDPRQLKNISPIENKPAIAHGVEPKRSSLTEPPKGYRKPISGAPIPQSEEAPVKNVDPASPYYFLNQQE